MQEEDILKNYQSERQPCEVWIRCMGYFRPVSCFNKGKKSEFNERKYFKEPCEKMEEKAA